MKRFSDKIITIDALSHYLFCPRSFALAELDLGTGSKHSFEINDYNTERTLLQSSDKRRILKYNIYLYSEVYDIEGIANCIEFFRCKKGMEISGLSGKYGVNIIKFCEMQPDGGYSESDAVIAFAQKLCADFMWGGSCSAILLNCKSGQMIYPPFDSEYERYKGLLSVHLADMREIIENGRLPPKHRSVRCTCCSFKDECFPADRPYSVKKIVLKGC